MILFLFRKADPTQKEVAATKPKLEDKIEYVNCSDI